MLDDAWRPDRSGLLIRLSEDGGFIFQPLRDSKRILVDGTSELIAQLVKARMPAYLSLRTRPGFTHALVHLNRPPFEHAVECGNPELIRSFLESAIEFGHQAKTDPVRAI